MPGAVSVETWPRAGGNVVVERVSCKRVVECTPNLGSSDQSDRYSVSRLH